ncbi:MAG: flagellar biosynthetic protein FliQ [Planctomycetaceae bacterium]
MTPSQLLYIAQDLLITAILLSLPAIGVSLVIGVIISLLQAVTSLQEQTLSFAPRILAVSVTLVATLPWSIHVATSFTSRMMQHFLEAVR